MIGAVALAHLAAAHRLTEASIVLDPVGAPLGGVSLNPKKPLYPASMIKVPIALALALRYERRERSPGDFVAVSPADITSNDAPSPFVSGYRATLAELAHAMLSASDNTATNVLIDVLGRATIGHACEPFGSQDTAVRRKLSGSFPLIDDPQATGRNTHPAADAALIFHEIERRRAAGDDALYRSLEAQVWNDKLSRGLRPGDTFAHKTGDTDEVSHDGGILALADGRRFVLVVYTALPATSETDPAFGRFAADLRREL